MLKTIDWCWRTMSAKLGPASGWVAEWRSRMAKFLTASIYIYGGEPIQECKSFECLVFVCKLQASLRDAVRFPTLPWAGRVRYETLLSPLRGSYFFHGPRITHDLRRGLHS